MQSKQSKQVKITGNSIDTIVIPVFAKKTSLPNFDSWVYFGVNNGATYADKYGESEFRAKIVPKPSKNSKF